MLKFNKIAFLNIALLMLFQNISYSKSDTLKYIGKVIKIRGEIIRTNASLEKKDILSLGKTILKNDEINSGPRSYIKILMIDDTIIQLGSNSRFKFSKFKMRSKYDRDITYELLHGKMRGLFIRKSPKKELTIKTPTAAMGVRGTKTIQAVTKTGDFHCCLEGKCSLSSKNAAGKIEKIDMNPGEYVEFEGPKLKEIKELKKVVRKLPDNVIMNLKKKDDLMFPQMKELKMKFTPNNQFKKLKKNIGPVDERAQKQMQKFKKPARKEKDISKVSRKKVMELVGEFKRTEEAQVGLPEEQGIQQDGKIDQEKMKLEGKDLTETPIEGEKLRRTDTRQTDFQGNIPPSTSGGTDPTKFRQFDEGLRPSRDSAVAPATQFTPAPQLTPARQITPSAPVDVRPQEGNLPGKAPIIRPEVGKIKEAIQKVKEAPPKRRPIRKIIDSWGDKSSTSGSKPVFFKKTPSASQGVAPSKTPSSSPRGVKPQKTPRPVIKKVLEKIKKSIHKIKDRDLLKSEDKDRRMQRKRPPKKGKLGGSYKRNLMKKNKKAVKDGMKMMKSNRRKKMKELQKIKKKRILTLPKRDIEDKKHQEIFKRIIKTPPRPVITPTPPPKINVPDSTTSDGTSGN